MSARAFDMLAHIFPTPAARAAHEKESAADAAARAERHASYAAEEQAAMLPVRRLFGIADPPPAPPPPPPAPDPGIAADAAAAATAQRIARSIRIT
jgi:hypothetical protein